MNESSQWMAGRRKGWAELPHDKRAELVRDFMENAAADFTAGAGMDAEAQFEIIRDAALALAKRFSGHGVRAWFEQRRREYDSSAGQVEPKALPPASIMEVKTFTIQ